MNGLLEHVWGVSPGADAVWALVCGMAPDRARTQLIMALKAFMDESETPGATLVIGGHVSTAEKWSNFSAEWEHLLPHHGVLDLKTGKYHFKMSEMAVTDERLERVPAFYRVIESNVLMSLSCRVHVAELRRARDRIFVPNLEIDWGYVANPWMVAFRVLMDGFHHERPKLERFLPNEPVDFIFDTRSEKKAIRDTWDYYVAERPESEKHWYGADPQFLDDMVHLPLQGADLWAWWVRKWHEEGTPEKMHEAEFGKWRGKRENHPKLDIFIDEEGLVKVLMALLAARIEPGRRIYDIKTWR